MNIIILHVLCPRRGQHEVHQRSCPRPGSLSPGLPGRLMRTQWQEESLVLAASPVERNQESTKRGRILPSAPIKWVLLRLLGRGRYCRSRVPQPGRRSELPRPNLSEIRAGKELPQAPSLLRGVVAAECVRQSRTFRARWPLQETAS